MPTSPARFPAQPPAGGTMARAGRLPGLTFGAAGPGLVVTSVETGGDAVLAIDGRSFRALDQAEPYLAASRRDQVLLRLREDGRKRLLEFLVRHASRRQSEQLQPATHAGMLGSSIRTLPQ